MQYYFWKISKLWNTCMIVLGFIFLTITCAMEDNEAETFEAESL